MIRYPPPVSTQPPCYLTSPSLYERGGSNYVYCLKLSGRQRRGNILKWINEIYHNLGMNCMNCVWIWKRKLFQSCSSDCFQPLNIMKLQSVFYIQYSQHIKKCFKKKQISEKWKNAFMHQQPKYLKNITFLLGVIHIVRTHKNRQN